jgi:hypothetical protein
VTIHGSTASTIPVLGGNSTSTTGGKLQSYYDVDNSVAEALEAGDKRTARRMVYENRDVLSRRDKENLLDTIERHPDH